MGLDQDIIIRPSDMSLKDYFEQRFEQRENPEHWTQLGVNLRKANQVHGWIFRRKDLEDKMDDYNCVEINLELYDLRELERMCEKIIDLICDKAILKCEDNPDVYYTVRQDKNKPRADRFTYMKWFKDGDILKSEDNAEEPNWNYNFDEEVAEKLEEMMPTTVGFFYGCYDYGMDYFWDIITTYSQIEKSIGIAEEHPSWKISYLSDW